MRRFLFVLLAGLLLLGLPLLWWQRGVQRGDLAEPPRAEELAIADRTDDGPVYTVVRWSDAAELRVTHRQLQQEFAFESLRARLAYEEGRQGEPDFRSARMNADEPQSRLRGLSMRAYALRSLHHEKADEFFNVPDDNGAIRTPPRSQAQILLDRPPRGPIAADLPVTKSSASEAEKLVYEQPPLEEDPPIDTASLSYPELIEALAARDERIRNQRAARLEQIRLQRAAWPSDVPSHDVLTAYFDQGHEIFCDDDLWGYVKSVDEVAGFIPHEFYERPILGEKYPGRNRRFRSEHIEQFSRWKNTELQLVGLLKRPEPRVYESRNLPAMSELVHAETRQLDDFERVALPRLQRGEEVVIATSTNIIRMLGALRARADCMECHSVAEKTLLGAFSYTLERDPPSPVKQVVKSAQ